MNLDEFRKHPAYKYYIETLVYNCLLSDLEDDFNNGCLRFIKVPNVNDKTIEYIISTIDDISDEVEERIQYYLNTDNYKDLYYIRRDNKFYFYLKEYTNDKL